MEEFIINTERLVLRRLTTADAFNFYQLNEDPLVVQYTGDTSFKSQEEAFDFLRNYDQYRKYGYGRWGVVLKSSGEWIGWSGLKYSPELDETDIGFRFFRKYWGQGFATESSIACLQYGFTRLKLSRIVGRARKDNMASIRVLEKIGMCFIDDISFDDYPGVLYEKTAEVVS